MKKKNKKSGRILIIIGVLLIAAALGKAAYNIWDGIRAGRESQEIAQQLINEIPMNGKQKRPSAVWIARPLLR